MFSYITKKTDGDTAWFEHDRCGMFIHDASEIRFRENGDGSVNFIIPGIHPNQTICTLESFLK